MSWESRARCEGHADLPWVPASAVMRQVYQSSVNLAREFCAECPVRRECFRWAQDFDTSAHRTLGIFGGHMFIGGGRPIDLLDPRVKVYNRRANTTEEARVESKRALT